MFLKAETVQFMLRKFEVNYLNIIFGIFVDLIHTFVDVNLQF